MNVTLGIIAIVNALGYLAVIYGFRWSARGRHTATWWFVRGFSVLAGAIVLRGLYWDFSLPLLRFYAPITAEWWTEIVNGRMINIVFALMKFYAVYCAMKCRWMLIPEEERDEWNIWTAWMHPTSIRIFPWSK